MTAMMKFWRNFRLGMLVLMFFGTLFYLLATFPFARYFGRTPTYSAQIAEGQPIVDAIYRFKAQRGLWPQYLDDLAPEFLPKAPSLKWNYQVLPGGDGPSLAMRIGDNGQDTLGYDFDPANPSWRALEGYGDRVLKRLPPPNPLTRPASDPSAMAMRQLQELDRRIAREPLWMEHRRAKAAILHALGRTDQARAVIAAAKTSNDNHFWPRLAEATLDLPAPATPGTTTTTGPAVTWPSSAVAFEVWVRAHPTFTHFYYLSLLDRLAGRNTEAFAAIEDALKQTIAADEDDPSPTVFYLWDMARFTLSQRQYDLTLKITDTWLKTQAHPKREEDSNFALSAAARLAKSDFPGAEADLRKLTARKTATWAKNVDALRDAVTRHDTAFHYDPGPNPPSYQVFQLPQ
jgi:hypothetical protein